MSFFKVTAVVVLVALFTLPAAQAGGFVTTSKPSTGSTSTIHKFPIRYRSTLKLTKPYVYPRTATVPKAGPGGEIPAYAWTKPIPFTTSIYVTGFGKGTLQPIVYCPKKGPVVGKSAKAISINHYKTMTKKYTFTSTISVISGVSFPESVKCSVYIKLNNALVKIPSYHGSSSSVAQYITVLPVGGSASGRK